MIVEQLDIPEVRLIKPRVFEDHRGHFLELWHEQRYAQAGIGPFVQDNASLSHRGVLRGLHFQHPNMQGKLISALHGEIFDVAVDVRRGSPTFGRWVSAILTQANGWQMYVPAGFAHGFQALSDDVVVAYKCTAYYAPANERTVRWDDPTIGVQWPLLTAVVKESDASAPSLSQLHEFLPRYNET